MSNLHDVTILVTITRIGVKDGSAPGPKRYLVGGVVIRDETASEWGTNFLFGVSAHDFNKECVKAATEVLEVLGVHVDKSDKKFLVGGATKA